MYSHQMLLPLDLPQLETYHFIHGLPNEEAWDFLCRYPNWPLIHTLIVGPQNSGKTTLAQSLASKHNLPLLTPDHAPIISELPEGDVIVDDAESFSQEWLFHLINHQQFAQKRVIALTQTPIVSWDFAFQDLASRMRTFYTMTIRDVDDELLFKLLQSGIQKRGIAMAQDDGTSAIDYLMRRMPRSYDEIQHILEHLDAFLLHHQKRLTLPQMIKFFEVYITQHI